MLNGLGYRFDLTLQAVVLMPNEVYQGMLIIKAVDLDKACCDKKISASRVCTTKNSLHVKVRVADLETRERLHFVPFPLPVR